MVNLPADQSTEQKILEAAKNVFISKGMAGARMQDIANEAGINKALLHYYFRSKDKLFEVIFREAIQRLFPKVVGILASEAPLFDKIRLFCREYITMVMANPYIPLFVVNEIHKQPGTFMEAIWGDKRPPVELLFDQVRREAEAGIIKPVPPEQLVLNMLSLCVFPFIGKPLWQNISGTTDEQFMAMMEERKSLVPEFIIESIRI
ncbi:TetR/AcrR family transcriptional regulator [Hufsiella ginkgonis]|uniref:TetR family transcriptional regulator n=1 Tax=Hufsiella ginkgonis TaxID=2695274 RepID=A0A7K1XVJ6_9SPHI|nr:TetR/AcrR family transcriptional regulator [Hufsiella ginkgonis]MXV14828.1 TetR family transcriptional regulator [Hufsiella ginkgonis]